MKTFALVGCGEIARQHARYLAAAGRLTAVCDIVPEKAEAAAKEYKAKAYYSFDELLEKEQSTEIMVVCTPNGLHAEHIIKSLQAGKQVICESPLCLTTAAAWQIIETEKFCRRNLFVVRPAAYNPLLQALKKAISENILGQIYSFQLSCLWHRPDSYFSGWKGKLFPDGGMLYTQFSQHLDALQWLLGDVKEAKGFSSNQAYRPGIETEDTGVVALQTQNGVPGTMHWSVNALRQDVETTFTLLAEKGTIRIGGRNLDEVKYHVSENVLTLPEGEVNYLERFYDEVMQALDSQEQPTSGAFAALKTIETIEKIYKATL